MLSLGVRSSSALPWGSVMLQTPQNTVGNQPAGISLLPVQVPVPLKVQKGTGQGHPNPRQERETDHSQWLWESQDQWEGQRQKDPMDPDDEAQPHVL